MGLNKHYKNIDEVALKKALQERMPVIDNGQLRKMLSEAMEEIIKLTKKNPEAKAQLMEKSGYSNHYLESLLDRTYAPTIIDVFDISEALGLVIKLSIKRKK